MNVFFQQAPFVRLLLPLLAGILCQVYYPVHAFVVFCLFILATIVLVVYHYLISPKDKFTKRHRFGILLSVVIFFGGLGLVEIRESSYQKFPYTHATESCNLLLVRLINEPSEKEKTYKAEAEIIEGLNDGKLFPLSGKILVYIKKDSLSAGLNYGDTLLIKNRLKEIQEPKNPYEFNYKQYALNHSVELQAYLQNGDWKLSGNYVGKNFFSFFYECRKYLLEKMKSNGITGQEYAVLSALVVGKTDEIEFDLLSSYASAGAIHVLAVSGLHVGLIYIILSLFIKPWKKNKRLLLIHGIVSILFLIFYAGLTGFSPSVNRATVMFCLMILAGLIQRQHNIYNTICSSAFFLLVWNPYYIMEVGFQLSYLAVLGIVLLQRRIYALLYVRNWLLDKAWQLTAVSIAAQLATFPLGMLYFHQFPNWFIVSNLFVIPLSTIILYLSILFFAISWWHPVNYWLAEFISQLTKLMNWSVRVVDLLPYSIVKGISISVIESYFFYGFVIACCIWWFRKNVWMLNAAMAFMIVLFVSELIEDHEQHNKTSICFHSIANQTAVTCSNHDKTWFIYSGDLIHQPSITRFHLSNYWDHVENEVIPVPIDSIAEFDDEGFYMNSGVVQFGNTRILLADKSNYNSLQSLVGTADYILIRKNTFIREMPEIPVNCKIILDNTCSNKYVSQLKNKIEKPENIFIDLHLNAFEVSRVDDKLNFNGSI